ncbi:hypothetical protein SFSGTM_15140 [Sulfuriferula nivalis]|uniref:Beta-propeller fold lactonase family protein n=2 Tax=Sulfuriferula nivalis TaxID=2675298 RepID=A0A809RGN8_9PROT|nr:hypothetical protein SFSGTM_15140 [Sulfuriferula nivalis]
MVCLAANGKSAYKYQRHQTDIPLSRHGEEWEESVNGVVSGVWRLSEAQGGSLEGDWQNPQSQRTLPIRLKKIVDADNSVPCETRAYKSGVSGDASAVSVPGTAVTVNAGNAKRPEYAYVVNIGDGTISAYSINSATGALTQVADSQLVAGASSITINPAGTFAYVATTKGDISIYRINPNTGALTQIEGSSVAVGKYPITVTVNPSGNIAYVTSNDSQTISQTILTYSINAKTGALTLIPGSPLMLKEGISSFTINPAGTFAYVATGNTISAYRINVTTGTLLTPVSGSQFMGDAVPGSLAINPAGTFVYVTNINEDSVSTYRINANTGVLTLVKGSPITAGKSPITVTVNPAGTFTYVANMGDNTISAYRITTTGTLTPIAGSPFYVSRQPQSVTISHAGTFLYIANTNNDSVSACRINAVTGTLTEVESSPFSAGYGPQSVTVVQP